MWVNIWSFCNKGLIIIILWGIILPLALGGLIYYLFCPDVFFVRYIDSLINNGVHVKAYCKSDTRLIYTIIRYYGLDFLWAYSLCNALYIFLCGHKICVLLQSIITICTGVLIEIAQGMGIIAGTMDVLDIFAEIIGTLLAIIFTTRRRRNEKT